MAELESEGELHRSEVARFLREFADEIEGRAATVGRSVEDADIPPTETADEVVTQDDDGGPGDTEGRRDRRRVTVIVGGDSATVTVPETVRFDIEIGSRSGMLSSGVDQQIDIMLSWAVEDAEAVQEEWLEVE